MDDQEEESGRPAPPRPVPPAPPPPELLKGPTPHVPLTPMMDFFQRRLDGLERELLIERERARSAEGSLKAQENLRSEVELHLKSVSDQVRREKAEREREEEGSQARGRVEALEKRLDEMHQSWLGLLRDAVARREGGEKAGSAALSGLQETFLSEHRELRQDLLAVLSTIKDLTARVVDWKAESADLAQVVPELRRLARDTPSELGGRLGEALTELRDKLGSFERRQDLEREKSDERLREFNRQKSDLLRQNEDQNHRNREESIKEGLRRQGESADRAKEVAASLEGMRQAQEDAARGLEDLGERVGRALDTLVKPPKAKDEANAALERERDELGRVLRERMDYLQRFSSERREVEKSLGESLVRLSRELDEERQKQRALSSRLSDVELERARAEDGADSARRLCAEKDDRLTRLADERDTLAKALMAEAERVREAAQNRSESDARWSEQVESLQRKLAESVESRGHDQAALSELRSQISTLTEHMTRALREKDEIAARAAPGEKEREKLLSVLKEKEGIISMLNATFQNLLKKA